MKNWSIAKKFTLIAFIVTCLMLVIGYLILNKYKNDLSMEVYENTKKELDVLSKDKIKSKFDVGISNAISISNDGLIKLSLKNNDRSFAIGALSSLSANMKASTPFKNIKVHIHKKNNHSFIRSWKTNKYGDDLSSFRASVKQVNSLRSAVNTFEVGKAGLSIRSVVPIFDETKSHLGSLEFMQGINSVAKSFDKNGDAFVLLMDTSLAVSTVNESKKLGKYLISQKFVNQDFINDSKTIDFNKLESDGYIVSDNYFYSYLDIKDFAGKKLGIALSARPLASVQVTIEHTSAIHGPTQKSL